MALIEVRDYHYDPDRMDDYREWAGQAGPWLRGRWDVSGYWVECGQEGQLFGADPQPSAHGPANVTWIIRWRDREERDTAWEALWQDDEWNDLGIVTPDSRGTGNSRSAFSRSCETPRAGPLRRRRTGSCGLRGTGCPGWRHGTVNS